MLLTKHTNKNLAIAPQLRTQYVDSIYNNLVTLKLSLRITQGHWKWNQFDR